MRIAYISSPSFFDCDISLIRELQSKGNDVYWFVKISPYSLKSACVNIETQIPFHGILPASEYSEFSIFGSYLDLSHTYIINDCRGKICRDTVRLYRELNRKIEDINPDIVHFVGNPDLLNAATFVRFSKKLVVTVHDPLPHSGEFTVRSEAFKKLLFRLVSRFILLNETMLDSFCGRYHIRKSNVTCSGLGLYDVINLFGKDCKAVVSGRYILFFGRISPYKGLDYLIPAMDNIAESRKDVSLVIAGKGTLPKSVINKDYIKVINDYVSNDDLVAMIRNAMFVVCPYTDATQSGVVSTVLALGTPMVVTDTGTMGEMVRELNAGIVVPPKDSQSLAEAMETLIGNPECLGQFRESISRNQPEHSWGGIASEYEELYRTLIAQQR